MSLKKSKPSAGSGTPLAPRMGGVPLPDLNPDDDVVLFMSSSSRSRRSSLQRPSTSSRSMEPSMQPSTRSKTPIQPPPRSKTPIPTPSSNPIKIPPILKSCLKKRDSSSSSTSSISSISSPPPRYTSREDVSIMSEAETSPTRLRSFRSRDLRADHGCAGSDYEMKPKKPKSILKKTSALFSHSARQPEKITLHWQMLPYDSRMSRKFLRFDISHPPKETVRDLLTGRCWSDSDYLKLASQPALDEMLIRCENGSRMEPWNIYVHRKGGIRCLDVFQAIQSSFSTPMEDDEKKKLSRTKLAACEKAFRRRCDSSAGLALWEERQGMKRVDLLEGRTIFLGLAMSPARDCWLLQLGHPSA